MYVCMYLCMDVHPAHVCMNVCMYACMDVVGDYILHIARMYVCMYVCVCMGLMTKSCTCVYAWAHTRMYKYVFMVQSWAAG